MIFPCTSTLCLYNLPLQCSGRLSEKCTDKHKPDSKKIESINLLQTKNQPIKLKAYKCITAMSKQKKAL